MKWFDFHHPDISWPVVRRRAGIEMLELMEMTTLFFSRGGWGLMNQSCYPNQAAYRNAASRLRRCGLIVQRSDSGETPRLCLTEAGRDVIPAYFRPETYWNRRWNGIWYLLVYDVPEVDRKYRNVLRQFLKRMRMGCLQQSVWVTPEDIRPDFDDLSKAASIDAFAFMFEAKTVLGLPCHRVVEEAWNLERLYCLQDHYCTVMQNNIDLLEQEAWCIEELGELVRRAVDGYHGVFSEDPLLPLSLYPSGYRGKEAVSLNRRLFELLEKQLNRVSSRQTAVAPDDTFFG
jgi:phenylacetic acid degradation operon negative regulatory protein